MAKKVESGGDCGCESIVTDVGGRVGASPTEPMMALMMVVIYRGDHELVIPLVNPGIYGNLVPSLLVPMNGALLGDHVIESVEDETAHFGVLVHGKEKQSPTLKPHSASITSSSLKNVSRYPNEHLDDVMTKLIEEPMYTKTHIIFMVPLPEDNVKVHVDVPADSVISSQPASTINIPITKSQQKRAKQLLHMVIRKKKESKKTIMQKLVNHEKRIYALSLKPIMLKSLNNLFKKMCLISTMKQALKLTPISLSKPFTTSLYDLSKYELKDKLFHLMHKNKSLQKHKHHLDLYNALMNSMVIDKLVAQGELDLRLTLRKRSHDDQDHLENYKGEKKREGIRTLQEVLTKVFSGQHANWFKQQNEKKSIEDAPEQRWFNELVDADKDSEEHELQIGSIIMFAKKMKGFLKMENITRADLKGPTFEILKNKLKNNLSKPLPLEGPPGRKTIPMRYFFNKDMEYLKHGNQEKNYSLIFLKVKAKRYEQEGIEEMIPHLWSSNI
nr:hypothetical protein [Tanacetum cinerariifolium]